MKRDFEINSGFFYALRAPCSSYLQVSETPTTSLKPNSTYNNHLYAIAVLYIVNNFLTLKNLAIFEPATYKVCKLNIFAPVFILTPVCRF